MMRAASTSPQRTRSSMVNLETPLMKPLLARHSPLRPRSVEPDRVREPLAVRLHERRQRPPVLHLDLHGLLAFVLAGLGRGPEVVHSVAGGLALGLVDEFP